MRPTHGHIRNQSRVFKILSALAVVAFLAAFATSAAPTPAPEKTPANVAGTWEVQVAGDTGAATQTLVIAQQDDKITGTFKGPRQSGTITGTVDGNNIKFHVTAGIPLDYTGTVDGDSMSGTMSGRGKTGDWKAARAK